MLPVSTKKLTKLYAAIALASCASIPTTLYAESSLALEEIIVTAQKRSQSIMEVPISMAVESGETLRKKGIADLQSLSIATPSVYVQDGGRTSQVTMRGLGSPGLDSVESSVGMYIDGIYFGRTRLSRNPLFDMERIEVLRGAQGTLYGRNTIAGAINMITATPTDDFEGQVLLEAGNHSSHKIEASVSGPLTEDLSARLAVYDAERGAYLSNSEGQDGGGQDTQGVRGSLRWAPMDTLEFRAKFETMDHANTGSYAQLTANPFNAPALQGVPNVDLRTDLDQQVGGTGINDLNRLGGFFESESFAMTTEWEMSDELRLTAITGWYDYTAESRDHITASPVDTLTIAGLTDRYEYWSQEFRIETIGDGPLQFIAGASIDNYQLNTVDNGTDDVAILNLGGPVLGGVLGGIRSALSAHPLVENIANGLATGLADSFTLQTPSGNGAGTSNLSQDIDTWSVYAEATYEFNDQWHLTFGSRYTEEENTSTFAKGTFYINGAGLPWGSMPTSAELVAGAVANDPALAGQEGLLSAVYGGTLSSPVGPGLTFVDLPSLIAANGGTPIATPKPLTEESFTGSAKLQYFASEDSMYYVSLVQGFKAGGFNSSNILPFTVAGDSFDSEDAIALEIGGKFTLADGAANLNVAVFRTDFDDLQIGTITAQGASVVVNAASAVSQGLEVDGAWRLSESVTVGGAYAYLDAEYTDSTPLVCGGYLAAVRRAAGETFTSSGDCTYNLDELNSQPGADSRLMRAPENTFNIYIQHETTISGWDVQSYLAANYREEANTSIENILRSDATTLLNGRIAATNEAGDLTIALYGNNLTDDRGLILRQDNSGSAVKGIITTPRTYAIQLIKRF